MLISAAMLLVAVLSLSCARVFPPAESDGGPRPTPAAQPPSAAHGLPPGDNDCLVCHGTDEAFLNALQRDHPVPLPPGFAGSPRDACALCHTMEPSHTAAEAMPHPLEGMAGCVYCHASRAAGITQMPAGHKGRAEDTCTMCHAPMIPETAPTPTSMQAATPAASPAPDVTKPASVPHTLAGMEACLTCHSSGMAGVSQIPANHSAYNVETCTLCHAQPSQ